MDKAKQRIDHWTAERREPERDADDKIDRNGEEENKAGDKTAAEDQMEIESEKLEDGPRSSNDTREAEPRRSEGPLVDAPKPSADVRHPLPKRLLNH